MKNTKSDNRHFMGENIREILLERLSWHQLHNGENIAIISDDKHITYKALYSLVGNVLTVLKESEKDLSVNIGICLEDPVMHMVTSLALLLTGSTQISMHHNNTLRIQQKMIDQMGIQLLLTDRDLKALCPNILPFTKDILSLSPKKYTDIGKIYPVSLPHIQDSIALIIMGSGTTGTPKIMDIDFNLLTHGIKRDLSIRKLHKGDRHYSVSSLHYYTTKRRSLGCILQGVTLMLPQNPVRNLYSFCQEHRVTHLSLTTSQALGLLLDESKYSSLQNHKLSHLKSLYVGSAPVSEPLRSKLREVISPNLYIVYGTNEFGEASIATPNDQKLHKGTVGKPCPDVTVQIVDDEGNICKTGVIGNIRLSSKTMMHNYFSKNTQNEFYPGDMGKLTEDGQLIFEGRKDDMMIYQGVNIYPREIESILEAHPNVQETAAFPFQTSEQESIPFAAVVAAPPIKENELLKWCFNEMGWKGPQRILFLKKLPRNSAGKIDKRELIHTIKIQQKHQQERLIFEKQKIPKIIHQSFHTKKLPEAVQKNIENLKKINPKWEYRFYDDQKRNEFIKLHYGAEFLSLYQQINPQYGAARADFFRYLLLYKMGGVWLDIKSSILVNLDDTLKDDDLFVLSQWQNKMGEEHQGFGLHPELMTIPGGEFQQWHIVTAPNNPFLKYVIQRVVENIRTYTAEKSGVGKRGVWRTTGPIVYTLTIASLLQYFPHRFVHIAHDFSFQYSIFKTPEEHRKLFKIHYSELKEPIVLH